MDIEELEQERETIKAQRQAYIDEANRQIGAFDGALAMLDKWIARSKGTADVPHVVENKADAPES